MEVNPQDPLLPKSRHRFLVGSYQVLPFRVLKELSCRNIPQKNPHCVNAKYVRCMSQNGRGKQTYKHDQKMYHEHSFT